MPQGESPYFENAPVVERVLGVQFEPLKGFHSGLMGVFWKTLGDEWSQVSDAPPIQPQFERFEGAPSWDPRIVFKFTNSPANRLQILNESGNRMIQLQNGRLHLNWKGEAGDDYPRYEQINREFITHYEGFQRFLTQSLGGEQIRANQWEVTYVNHLPKGSVWQTPEDWPALFRIPSSKSHAGGAVLESFSGAWHYELPNQCGRLHVEISRGQRDVPEKSELLIVNLTARGPVDQETSALSIREGLDLGHQTIVNAFVDLTSDRAHEFWRLQ